MNSAYKIESDILVSYVINLLLQIYLYSSQMKYTEPFYKEL